jgi:hypothetical protein
MLQARISQHEEDYLEDARWWLGHILLTRNRKWLRGGEKLIHLYCLCNVGLEYSW